MRFVSLALIIGLVATLSQGLANFVLKNALKQFNKQYPGLASMSRSTRSSLTHAGYDGLSPKIKNMVQKYKMRANRPLPVWKTVNTINITWIKWHNIDYWYLNSIMHSKKQFLEFCIWSLFSAGNDLEAIDQIPMVYGWSNSCRTFFSLKSLLEQWHPLKPNYFKSPTILEISCILSQWQTTINCIIESGSCNLRFFSAW